MKYIRITAVVLALLMVLSACGGKTEQSVVSASEASAAPVTETSAPEQPASAEAPDSAEQPDSAEEPEPTPEPTPKDEHLGDAVDGVYANEFLGLGCAFDDSWALATQTDLGNLQNNISDLAERVDDSLAGMMRSSGALYDLYALDYEGYRTVNVNLENTKQNYGRRMTETVYAENCLDQLRAVMGTMGLEDSEMELTEMEFAGETHVCIDLSGTLYGYDFYERIVCFRQGEYMAVITAACYQEDETERLLEKFYTLD